MLVKGRFLEGGIRRCCSLSRNARISILKRTEKNKEGCPRREITVRLVNLKKSGGRALISLFARKIIKPWDRVREGAARCEKKDRCDDEKTAGGAVCTRLNGRCAVSDDTTPRLLSSTMDGGTNVSPAFLRDSVNTTFYTSRQKKKGDDDTHFHVNSASPVSTARVILSSHSVASSGGSGSKLDVENPSSSSSKKLSRTFVRSAAERSGL